MGAMIAVTREELSATELRRGAAVHRHGQGAKGGRKVRPSASLVAA